LSPKDTPALIGMKLVVPPLVRTLMKRASQNILAARVAANTPTPPLNATFVSNAELKLVTSTLTW